MILARERLKRKHTHDNTWLALPPCTKNVRKKNSGTEQFTTAPRNYEKKNGKQKDINKAAKNQGKKGCCLTFTRFKSLPCRWVFRYRGALLTQVHYLVSHRLYTILSKRTPYLCHLSFCIRTSPAPGSLAYTRKLPRNAYGNSAGCSSFETFLVRTLRKGPRHLFGRYLRGH